MFMFDLTALTVQRVDESVVPKDFHASINMKTKVPKKKSRFSLIIPERLAAGLYKYI